MKKRVSCPCCKGRGRITVTRAFDDYCGIGTIECAECHGTEFMEVPTTNADRIRAMSDEKLEQFIREIAIHCEPWCDNHCKMDGDDDCNKCLAKWLRQPASDDESQYSGLVEEN